MMSLLARIGSPQAMGIYVEGATVYASRMAASPVGPVEIERRSRPVGEQPPIEVIKQLVAEMASGSEKLPVSVGLPIDQTFFTTRPMQIGGGEASPRVLLREAVRSTSVSVEEMVVDVIRSQPGSRRLASIVACRRELIERLVEPLRESRWPKFRVEPAPCALLRRGIRLDKAQRRNKSTCRVFVSDVQVMAVLTAKRQPVLWRQAPLPRGDEGATILAVVRSVTTIAEQSGLETRPESIVIHGRSDLTRLLDMDWLHQQFEVPVEWVGAPELDAATIAGGLAEGCLNDVEESFDLARGFQPERTLWQLFPWREAGLHAAMLLCLAVFLGYRLTVARDAYAAASMRNAQSSIASMSMAALQKEKKDLDQRVSAALRFLDDRIVWTNYVRDLSASLPDNIFLTSLRGESVIASKKSKKAGKQLVLKGAVSLPQSGLIPVEVDDLLKKLRAHPTLQRDFAVVELAELKQYKQTGSDQTLALFTVMCLPKGKK